MGSDPIPSYLEPGSLPGTIVTHPPRRRYWLHALLFLLTILTTLIVGARLEYNFQGHVRMFVEDQSFFALSWIIARPSRLLLGIPFSASLLAILMAHEMGHFLYAVRYNVYATLPFFIPAPTPFGTLGAFIQIRSPFHDRQALFDIGIAGPIAGFAVAVPLTLIGLAMSVPVGTNHPAAASVGYPLIFQLCQSLLDVMGFAPQHPPDFALILHPVAIAAWIGMLATALNLIPGGQLDGGHILYALAPRRHRQWTRISMVALFVAGFYFWAGWIVWGIALRLTIRHPLVPEYPPMSPNRRYLAYFGLAMFVLTFTIAPFAGGGFYDILKALTHR